MSKRGEEQVDPEQQFILRLPEDIAAKLDGELKRVTSSCSKLAISIENDYRNCELAYEGEVLKAKLHDLPCIIESLKTTDGKNYYKTADVSQIMIAERASSEKYNNRKTKRSSKVYLYPHGLTPPLKNVRRSRFRKILKKKYIESPDVENEVKALLKSDLYATSLPTYQLVDDNHSNSTTATEAAKGSDSLSRAELNRVFEEVSSEEENQEGGAGGPPSSGLVVSGGTGGGYEDDNEATSGEQLDEQVRSIMREVSDIQKRRQQIKQQLAPTALPLLLATVGGHSEKLSLEEELSLLHSRETTKLLYLEELRNRMRMGASSTR